MKQTLGQALLTLLSEIWGLNGVCSLCWAIVVKWIFSETLCTKRAILDRTAKTGNICCDKDILIRTYIYGLYIVSTCATTGVCNESKSFLNFYAGRYILYLW